MYSLALMLQQTPDPAAVRHMAILMLTIFPIVLVVAIAISLPPYWMIFKKAGFSPWLSLLVLLPVVNIVILWVVGFSTWKVVPGPQTIYPTYPPMPPNA